MSLKFKKKILLFKIESTEGTDATPTGALDAVLTKNLDISPMEGSVVNRDVDRATLGNDLSIHVGTYVKCSFDVEFSGAGAAGDAPGYAPVLRACGLSETLTAVTDAVYQPISAGAESATIYIHLDGQLHKLVGSKGTFSLALSPEGIPYYKFDFTGLWVDPASIADPTAVLTAFQVPLAVTNDNTPTLTVHGLNYNVSDFSYDHANDVKYRNVIGQESVTIVDRTPKGAVTIDAPALSAKNWFTTAKANTTGVIQMIHGTTAGNIIQIDMPNVQLLSPKYGDKDGIRTISMDMNIIPVVGDDEFILTIR